MKLYLVKMTGRENDEVFYKLGVTNHQDVMLRFTTHGEESRRIQAGSGSRLEKITAAILGQVYEFPYLVTLVHEVVIDSNAEAEAVEASFLAAVSDKRYKPQITFSGWTECFEATDEDIQLLVEVMINETDDAKRDRLS